MNRRAFYFGLAYSVLIIVYKLFILFGNYTYTKFGFYYSNLVGNLAIIPFFFACIWMVRQKDYLGYIGGRESMRIAFTVLATAMLFVSVYNYLEGRSEKFRAVAIEYYKSATYLNLLQEQQKLAPTKIKTEDFPKIIEEQIAALHPFKATTFKLIPMLFFGMAGAFMAAITLRKKRKSQTT